MNNILANMDDCFLLNIYEWLSNNNDIITRNCPKHPGLGPTSMASGGLISSEILQNTISDEF